MNGLYLLAIFAVIALAIIAVIRIRIAKSAQENKHSSAKVQRFATNAAIDVLSSNWNSEEYYMRLYKYASQELASHMYSNRSLLNKVLEERAELLGDFIEIRGLGLSNTSFQLIPSQIIELKGTLHCKKGQVPIVVLVNGSKEQLSLDGIKVDKRSLSKGSN